MPRTCTVCKSPDREKIDAAIVSGTSFRSIAKRYALSGTAVFRHKLHVAKTIVKAADRRDEQLGDNAYEEMQRVQRKAWQLLTKMEKEKDHRGAIVAVREVRECVESLGAMMEKAGLYRKPLPAGITFNFGNQPVEPGTNFFRNQREINVIVDHIGAKGGEQGKPQDEAKELPAPALPEVVPTDEEKGRAGSAGGSVENPNGNGSNGTKASGVERVEMPTAEELKAWRKGDSTELQRLGPSFSPGPRLSWPIRGRRNRN